MKIIGDIRRKKTETAFTMVEVVVAALVFGLAAAGIFATSASLNQPNQDSDEEVKAMFLGKEILESLRVSVRQDTWNTGNLIIGQNYSSNAPIIIDGTSYNWTYDVEADPMGSDAKKVTLNVIW